MPHLAVNNLAQLGGASGLHVFVVGVSAYAHLPGVRDPARPATFGLRKLSSAAMSAYAFYEWITANGRRFRRPLATCHLLLAPSPEELAAVPDMENFRGATVADFVAQVRQWRRLCGEDPKAQTVFFFCGHGVQPHDTDAVLLFEDFGDPESALDKGCVRFSNIFEGMAPHTVPGTGDNFDDIAREQIFFIDACRENPEVLAALRSFQGATAFDPPLSGLDTRDAPVFFSTTPGEQAFGERGQISIFTGALLDALQRACNAVEPDEDGNAEWPVRVRFLHQVLKQGLISRINGPAQRIGNLQGLVGDPTIHYLPEAPQIETQVNIVPADFSDAATIEIQLALDNQPVWSTNSEPRPSHPFKPRIPLGVYRIVAAHPDCKPFLDMWIATPDETAARKAVRLQRMTPSPPPDST